MNKNNILKDHLERLIVPEGLGEEGLDLVALQILSEPGDPQIHVFGRAMTAETSSENRKSKILVSSSLILL